MSSFGQWSKGFPAKGPARVTWVCGPERVLVREVTEAVAESIHPDETETWTAGRDKERDIWASVMAIPFTETRLVVVRDAGRLKDWRKLQTWMAEKFVMRGVYLVFDAVEGDFPREDGKLAEPCTWLRDSTVGQIVRCMPLDREESVAWACRRMPGLSSRQAGHLLDRASGDLSEVRTVLAKASLFRGPIHDSALDLLCQEIPGDFVDRLIIGDRKGAMLAAESLGSDGLGFSIGLLASRLQTLASLHRAARDNMSRRDVVSRLGVPAFLAQKYAGVARDYGEERVSRCWSALAAVEDAYRSGNPEGAAEVLVVSW